MAESISEGTLKSWLKQPGDFVNADEEVATIETDKVSTPSIYLALGPSRQTCDRKHGSEHDSQAAASHRQRKFRPPCLLRLPAWPGRPGQSADATRLSRLMYP